MQQLKLLSDQILTDWEGIKLQKSVLVPMIWYEFSKEFFFRYLEAFECIKCRSNLLQLNTIFSF